MRWSAALYSGTCRCGRRYEAGAPTIYDSAAKQTVRCGSCPDLSPEEQRAAAKIVETAKAKEAAAAENLRRAQEGAGDLKSYISLAGTNLGIALPMIAAHEGIAADCARHGLAVSSLIAALVHMAAADATRSACTVGSWMSAAQQCAEWGLLPTTAGDTPVYIYCRDPRSNRLSCERTRWGYATQIARALPDAEIVTGWTFQPEAILGDLAQRIRDRKPGAAEEAEALRARLEARAGGLDEDQTQIVEALRRWLIEDRPLSNDLRPALIRLGKDPACPAEIKPALRKMLRPAEECPPENMAALQDYMEDLESRTSGLTPAEESLLSALRLPGWTDYLWYIAAGPEKERTIEWSPPSYALWSRPPMNPRRLDGVPVVWWVRLTFTDGTTRREIGFELERADVYERACAGKTVVLTSAGLLQPATEKQTPWMDWHGEMGTVKTIREMLKAHPVLFERLRAHVGALDEDLIETKPAPLIGVEHLRAARQIEQQDRAPDFEPVSERVAVEVRS